MNTTVQNWDNAKESLRQLVELFRHNIVQYKSAGYDEANVRTDFIDKFFELLGWDVRNVAGYSEQYRDATSDSDRKTRMQRVEVLDRQINAIVYELYGLTDEEIEIVERGI